MMKSRKKIKGETIEKWWVLKKKNEKEMTTYVFVLCVYSKKYEAEKKNNVSEWKGEKSRIKS